jgi:hypothetical protein
VFALVLVLPVVELFEKGLGQAMVQEWASSPLAVCRR